MVSGVFFAIHLGLALANVEEGPGIAVLNAASGLCFLVAVVYGQRAWTDMDPSPAD